MKVLSVPYVEQEALLESIIPAYPIDNEPWSDGNKHSCEASFSIAHFDKGIFIKYAITEQFLRAKKRKPNGEVHKDNCVEFFIAFDKQTGYYNFEFNCLGSMKVGFGEQREHKTQLPPHLFKLIEDNMEISIDNNGEGNRIRWTLSVVLPISVFFQHHFKSLSGLNCLANFTNCGDDLPEPHFLTWAKLISPTPDFHQPSCFKKLIFESNDHAS